VGVVDKRGVPLRGLTPADFVVTVGGQPRRVVTAEFIDQGAAQAAAPAEPEVGSVSTNEGTGVGRLFAFIVDENTLDPGGARRVADAAGSFLSRLTFADRSAVMVLPTGPSVAFTWAHDRVRSTLQRVVGMGRPVTGWEYGSLGEARDIAAHDTFALRIVGERVCGTASTARGGASSRSIDRTAGQGVRLREAEPGTGTTPAFARSRRTIGSARAAEAWAGSG
jgi:hypothetical protein